MLEKNLGNSFLLYLVVEIQVFKNIFKRVIQGDFGLDLTNIMLSDFLKDLMCCNLLKIDIFFKVRSHSCVDIAYTNTKFSFIKSS